MIQTIIQLYLSIDKIRFKIALDLAHNLFEFTSQNKTVMDSKYTGIY